MKSDREGGSPFGTARGLRSWLAAGLLVAVTLLAYIPAMRAGFLWDDGVFLTNNALIKAPDGLRQFWFSTKPPDYFPLTSTMLWFEWRLWHMNPAGYHVVNILLHAAGAVLVWRVLARLIPQGGTGAWFAGLIFAVHPVCVASVAWISELKNTLSLPLFLGSLLLYLRFDETDSPIRNLSSIVPRSGTEEGPQSRERYAAPLALCSENTTVSRKDAKTQRTTHLYLFSLLLFLLALLAKTSVVMLPAVLLLCAWWRRGKVSRRDLLRAVPFAALALALSAVTVWFQYHRAIGAEVVRTDSLLARTAVAGWAAWFYLYKTLLPAGLCGLYPRWTTSAAVASFLPALILLAAMLLFWLRRDSTAGSLSTRNTASRQRSSAPLDGCRPADAGPQSTAADCNVGSLSMPCTASADCRRGWPQSTAADCNVGSLSMPCTASADCRRGWPQSTAAVLFGLGYFLAMLLPILGFLNMSYFRYSLVADHLQYAALIGIIAPAVGGVYFLARDRVRTAMLICVATAAGLGALTWDRCHAYHDEETLWHDTLSKNPDTWAAWNELGYARHQAGLYEKTLPLYDRAIMLKPDFEDAYVNRAAALIQLGRYAEALNDCDTAIALKPVFAAAYRNRAAAFIGLGRYADALADCDKAIRYNPGNPIAYLNRSAANMHMDRYQLAVDDCDKAIALKPDYGEAYENRTSALGHLRRYAEALGDLDEVIRLKPDDVRGYVNRGSALIQMGRYAEALDDFNRVIRLKPGNVQGYLDRATTLCYLGRYSEALEDCDQAIRLHPADPAAYVNRSAAHLHMGRYELAVEDCDQAILLRPDFTEAYRYRALARFSLKEYGKAREDMNTYVKLGGRPDPAFIKRLDDACAGRP